MTDTIIKGTGNSRTLKTPTTLPATWEEARAQLIAGTFQVDIGPLVAAGVQQQGMSLTKANLLADATGTKLGLATTATPNDALSALASRYGTCSTAAATKAKVVTLAGFTLATGAVVAVKFTYANTAASPTLNVNSTGAKSIAVYGSTAAGSGAWSAGEVVMFVYDGTRWVMISGSILGTGNGCEIYAGSYTGDGAASKSLTFPKVPVFMAISVSFGGGGQNSYVVNMAVVKNGGYFLYCYGTSASKSTTISISGSTVSINGSSGNPFNSNSYNYWYVAFALANGNSFS